MVEWREVRMILMLGSVDVSVANWITIDSFAAHHQSLNYRGYIPPNTLFSRFQSYGATHHDPVLHFYEEHEEDPVTTVLSWLASLSAIFILGKEWGLWDVQVAANKLM